MYWMTENLQRYLGSCLSDTEWTHMDIPLYPLHATLLRQQTSFSLRLIQPRCHKEHMRKALLPFSVKLYDHSALCDRHGIPHRLPLDLHEDIFKTTNTTKHFINAMCTIHTQCQSCYYCCYFSLFFITVFALSASVALVSIWPCNYQNNPFLWATNKERCM